MPLVITIFRAVPASVRGELSQWFLEPEPGVFVGYISARVRDKLWERCCAVPNATQLLQIYSSNTTQKFEIRQYGATLKAELCELEGLQLMRMPLKDKKRRKTVQRHKRQQNIENSEQ